MRQRSFRVAITAAALATLAARAWADCDVPDYMLGSVDSSSCISSDITQRLCGWDGERVCTNLTCNDGVSYDWSLATCQLPSLSCATPAPVYGGVPLDVTFLIATDVHAGSTNMPVWNFQHNVDVMNVTAAMAQGRGKLPTDLRWPSWARSGQGQLIPDPVALVMTGDLTNGGLGWEWGIYRTFYEEELYDAGNGRSHEIRMPVYPGIGNHDAQSSCLAGQDCGGCTLPDDCTSRYKNYMDQRVGNCPIAYSYDSDSKNYSWNWNNVHLVQLNTWAGDSRGERDQGAGLTWLAGDLATVGNRPVIIFQHYDFSTGFWNTDDQQSFFNVINGKNVIAIFAGHSHVADDTFWNGYKVYIGSHGGLQDYSDPPGFFAVHLTDEYLDVAHYIWDQGELNPAYVDLDRSSSRGRIYNNSSTGNCLDVARQLTPTTAPFMPGMTLQVQSCAGRELNQFFDFSAGFDPTAFAATEIKIGNGPLPLCLTETSPGAAPTLQSCTGSKWGPGLNQNWTVRGSQLVSPSGLCLQAQGHEPGSAVVLSACHPGAGAQRWIVAGSHAQSATWYFNDSQPYRAAPYAATVRLADIDGDGRADVCGAQSDGLYCGLSTSTVDAQFATPRLASRNGDFGDAWLGAGGAATLQLGDIDGDHRADACIRGAMGISCALSNGDGTFGSLTRWSWQFGGMDCQRQVPPTGCWTDPVYSGSLRLADVDGDGKADLCGRWFDGIYCALSTGTSFGPRTRWSAPGDFTDAAGWHDPSYSNLMFANFDADANHRADVCARGSNGINCAISTGSGFTTSTLWSPSFNDAGGWMLSQYADSLQAAHYANGGWGVCGRSSVGVLCVQSNGASFNNQTMLAMSFNDALGWSSSAAYWDTIRIADVTGDGRADVCGRDLDGMVCATTEP